jgi:peptidoglycan/LPS O-acetylase OafA/YrhL
VSVAYALGEASYSIYLVQFFTLAVVGRLGATMVWAASPGFVFAGALVVTVAVGWSCHLLLERPLILLFDRLMSSTALEEERRDVLPKDV